VVAGKQLESALFNLPPGDWAGGERGLAALPGREADFRASVARALEYALAMGTPRVHAMAGLLPVDADQAYRAALPRNLSRKPRSMPREELAKHERTLLIEPINGRDMPGYFLNSQADGHAIREAVGEANLKVQMDFYHAQIVEGDLATTFRKHFAGIGHVQIASVPARNEPDDGEVNYPLPVQAARRAGLRRLGRLRIPAARPDRGWPGLVAGLASLTVRGKHMKIVITGGAGFLGQRLARRLLEQGSLTDATGERRGISEIVLLDVVAAGGFSDSRLREVTGDIADPDRDATGGRRQYFASIFHLAAVVSGQAEADFDLGMRINLDASRQLLDVCRQLGHRPRVVFTSSVAVYGGRLPAMVDDETAREPQSSYGVQKAIGELLLGDYHRRGFIDGRVLRLPTISVRPGKPNKAASELCQRHHPRAAEWCRGGLSRCRPRVVCGCFHPARRSLR
jgi:hydroxypyruvate isomerase